MKKGKHSFDFAAVVAAMDAGRKVDEVAAEHGISRGTVYTAVIEGHPERPRRRRKPRSDEKRIVALHRKGTKVADIARRTGTDASTVYRVLKRKGFEFDPSPDRLNLDAEAIRRQYDAGATLRGLADEHGTTKKTIERRILRAGGKVRSNETRLRTAELARRYKAGESCSALAREHGVTWESVATRLRAAAVRMRTRKEATSGPKTGASTWDRAKREVRVKTPAGWRQMANMVWERHHGPVPAGCVVQRVDKALPPKRIHRLENLVLVDRKRRPDCAGPAAGSTRTCRPPTAPSIDRNPHDRRPQGRRHPLPARRHTQVGRDGRPGEGRPGADRPRNRRQKPGRSTTRSRPSSRSGQADRQPEHPPGDKRMRAEIHRWKMATPKHDDGRVDVGYAIYVREQDVPAGFANGATRIHLAYEGKPVAWEEYHVDYRDATWRSDEEPGYGRYAAWLEHKSQAERRMMALLHEHCPETREHDRWSSLWLAVREPSSLTTIVIEVDDPEEPGSVARNDKPDTDASEAGAASRAGHTDTD